MEKFRRKNYFIDKKFQARFIIKFCVIVILSSLVIGASLLYLSRNFTTVAIENAHVTVKNTADFMLPIVAETLILVTILSAVSVIALTLFTSHKIAGPLYRLKKEIEEFKNGQLSLSFRTRNTDQLKDLSEALAEMSKVLGAKHLALKGKMAELKESLKSPGTDHGAILSKLGELESIINYFKI